MCAAKEACISAYIGNCLMIFRHGLHVRIYREFNLRGYSKIVERKEGKNNEWFSRRVKGNYVMVLRGMRPKRPVVTWVQVLGSYMYSSSIWEAYLWWENRGLHSEARPLGPILTGNAIWK